MRITVGMLKGGASRTTTAVYLALAEWRRSGGPVLLVDADQGNGTALEWHEDAGDAWPEEVEVVFWPSSNLARRVGRLVGGDASVVIDTGNEAAAIRAGLEATDHLVIPIAPTGPETARFRPTLEAAAEVGARKSIEVSVLVTRAVANTRSLAGAREALAGVAGELGLHILEAVVPRLERIANAYGTVPDDLAPYSEALEELHGIELEGRS